MIQADEELLTLVSQKIRPYVHFPGSSNQYS